MLQELTITPSTIVLVAVIMAFAVLAVRRMLKKGLCDCHDGCEGCSSKKKGLNGKSACPHCGAVESMVSKMEASLGPFDK